MNYLGISAGYHDAAVTVIDAEGNIQFAGHSERYSKLKNDSNLSDGLISELCGYEFDTVAYYERPWMHNLQQVYSGQRPTTAWTVKGAIRQQLGAW